LFTLFTTHDLGTAHEIWDRVVVMYAGQERGLAPTDAFFHRPAHSYTRCLLDSVPTADGQIRDSLGNVPSLIAPPPGCRFHPRCEYATSECHVDGPGVHAVEGEHRARCYHPVPPSRSR
jgi:peptide/nickel transport system ATP-binding protein